MADSEGSVPFLALDPFAHRQFDAKSGKGIPIEGCTKENFIKKVNELYEEAKKKETAVLVDGYAPFCKHIFVPNFTQTKSAYVAITSENRSLLQSEYKARRPTELAVLSRWFPKEKVKVGVAKYLDLILYSREQINKENEAMGVKNPDKSPWGIVSIKPQDEDHETPMQVVNN
mmetsp:Transcript_27545/g.44820  ORF Transcript_27545/g.44820 Transcript_27545/m.44820 type:complete len:173 (+) Transcript_27545:1291-1809(+)